MMTLTNSCICSQGAVVLRYDILSNTISLFINLSVKLLINLFDCVQFIMNRIVNSY